MTKKLLKKPQKPQAVIKQEALRQAFTGEDYLDITWNNAIPFVEDILSAEAKKLPHASIDIYKNGPNLTISVSPPKEFIRKYKRALEHYARALRAWEAQESERQELKQLRREHRSITKRLSYLEEKFSSKRNVSNKKPALDILT